MTALQRELVDLRLARPDLSDQEVCAALGYKSTGPLKAAEVQAELRRAYDARRERSQSSCDAIVSEIEKIAFTETEGTLRVADQLKALDLLAKIHGMVRGDKVEITVSPCEHLSEDDLRAIAGS